MKFIKFITFIIIIFLSQEIFFTKTFAQQCGQIVTNLNDCPNGCTPVRHQTAPNEFYYDCKEPTTAAPDEGKITNPALNPNVGAGQGEVILAKILAAVINLFFIAGSLAVLIYLLMGGLAYITSEGDKGKIEVAKSRLTSAVFGMVVIAATYAILTLLGKFLGIDFFTDLIIKWPRITD